MNVFSSTEFGIGGAWLAEYALEAVDAAVVLFDDTGRIVQWNGRAPRVLQQSVDELGGRRIGGEGWDVVDADGVRLACRGNPIWDVLVTGRPVAGFVLGVPRPDGTRSSLSLSALPVFNPSGQTRAVLASFSEIDLAIGVALTGTDIDGADRNRSQPTSDQAVHQPWSFEYSLVAHLVVDGQGRVIDWNQRLLAMTGRTEFDVVDRTLDELCNISLGWLWAALDAAEGAPVEGHTWVIRLNQAELPVFGHFRFVDHPSVGRVVVVQLLDSAEYAPRTPLSGRIVGRAAFNHSPVAMLVVSSEGEIIEVNSATSALLGRAASELVQEPLTRHVIGIAAGEWKRATLEAFGSTGLVDLGRRVVLPGAGQMIDADVQVSSMQDGGSSKALLLQLTGTAASGADERRLRVSLVDDDYER